MLLWLALGFLVASALFAAATLIHVWRAGRSNETWRAEVRSEVRSARIQLSNIIRLLMAAGYKMPKRQGWEDDFQETQLRDSSPSEVSWWRPKQ